MTDNKFDLAALIDRASNSLMADANPIDDITLFLQEAGILSEWEPEDVEINHPKSDEDFLLDMTDLERDYFCLAAIVQAVLDERMHEIETRYVDKIRTIMKDHHLTFLEARDSFMRSGAGFDRDDLIMCNKATAAIQMFDAQWRMSVRRRSNNWTRLIVVRSGWRLFAFGPNP